jgi:hypothetical protein
MGSDGSMFSPEQGSVRSQTQKLAKELSLEGQVHKENMVRLDKEASAKVFQGMELTNGTCVIHEVAPKEGAN